ncbi:MAG: hypothetical protein Q9173_001688 [Seirophora scorigena]
MSRRVSSKQDQVVEAIPNAFSDDQLWILATLKVIENLPYEKIARTLQHSKLIMGNGCCCTLDGAKAGPFTAESVESKYKEMMSASRTNKNSNQKEPLSDRNNDEAVSEANAQGSNEAEEIKLLTKHRNRSKSFYIRQPTHHEDDSSADDDDDHNHSTASDPKTPDPDHLNKLYAIYQYCLRCKIPNYAFPLEYADWAIHVLHAQLTHKTVEFLSEVGRTTLLPQPTIVPKVPLPALELTSPMALPVVPEVRVEDAPLPDSMVVTLPVDEKRLSVGSW